MAKSPNPPVKEVHIPLVFEGQSFLLAKFDTNWADEMDMDGFRVFTEKEWEEYKARFPKKDYSVGFGTNESNEYDDIEDFFNEFKLTPISIEEAQTLYKLFGRKDVDCQEWDGKQHNLLIHSTICEYGQFPSAPDPDDFE